MKSYGWLLTTFYCVPSPLGPLLLAGRGGWLSGLWFEGARHCPAPHPAEIRPQRIALEWDMAREEVADQPPFVETTLRWLRAYFSGLLPLPPLPNLDLHGTPFQLAVWRELLDVPFATTLSYGALALRVAHRLQRPSAGVRAVAGAVGRNPVSILVPCHRIVGARGALGGYAGGVDRKVALLAHEGEWADGRDVASSDCFFLLPSAVDAAACRRSNSAAANVH